MTAEQIREDIKMQAALFLVRHFFIEDAEEHEQRLDYDEDSSVDDSIEDSYYKANDGHGCKKGAAKMKWEQQTQGALLFDALVNLEAGGDWGRAMERFCQIIDNVKGGWEPPRTVEIVPNRYTGLSDMSDKPLHGVVRTYVAEDEWCEGGGGPPKKSKKARSRQK